METDGSLLTSPSRADVSKSEQIAILSSSNQQKPTLLQLPQQSSMSIAELRDDLLSLVL